MSAETMAKIRRLSEAIAGLDGVVTYLNGKNFETSDLATLQTLLTNYAITEGYTQPLPNSLIVNNWFDGHEYIYNSEDSSWIDYGATTASIATQETAGLIQGSLTKYKVKMESDGTGTVNNLIDLETSVTNHTGNTNNPHAVTKTQVGLGSVDNTADSAKSVSKAATLTTARTIGISGAVTGTATSFNGSANITVPATALAASYLSGTIPAAVLAVTQAATVRNTTIATTAFVGLATRKMWTGAWAAVPDNGGIRTITHSLALTAAQIDGAEIEFDLKCITANRGWAVNDVLKNIALVREGYAYYGNPYKILTNTVTFWAYAACFAFGDYDTVNGNITTEQSGKFQFRIRLFYT
jgi:hypothetical protein